ncbi:hypothetical protein ACGFNP_51085 [Nonomuraea sp. NPDC049269]|uniref:hypothetical protein n=1 Tax=Nonomuraea sp. NPDC049269 TaxID=3364349 RepID=UPI00371FC198
MTTGHERSAPKPDRPPNLLNVARPSSARLRDDSPAVRPVGIALDIVLEVKDDGSPLLTPISAIIVTVK